MINKILYYKIRLLWKLLGTIPLGVLYLFSDFFYVIIYYLIGYRRDVVMKNLSFAYPEKSKEELTQISKRFYRFLCDIFFEASKFGVWSGSKMKRHMKFVNYEALNDNIYATVVRYRFFSVITAIGSGYRRYRCGSTKISPADRYTNSKPMR